MGLGKYRSSRLEAPYKKDVQKKTVKLSQKYLQWRLIFMEVPWVGVQIQQKEKSPQVFCHDFWEIFESSCF